MSNNTKVCYYPTLDRYTVASDLFAVTLETLRRHGCGRTESLVYWAGSASGASAAIHTVIVPVGDGVVLHPRFVSVSEDAMSRVTEHLDPPDLVLLGQVHTHGLYTEHSELDDERGFRTPGLISVIIERYGFDDRPWQTAWGWHESEGQGVFRRIDPAEVIDRFLISDRKCTILEA